MRRLTSLVLLSVVSFAVGASASPASRFGLRSYQSGAQSVAVEARHDMVAVRFAGADDAVAVVVDGLLQKVQPAARVVRAWSVVKEKKAGGGLTAVTVSIPLDEAGLADLAVLVEQAGGLLWPVLTRPGTGTDNRAFADDRLVVTAEKGQLDAMLPGLLGKTGGTVVAVSKYLDDTAVIAVGAAFGHDAVAASAALRGTAGVVSAEPNLFRELRTNSTVNDPLFPQQWHLQRNASQNVPGTGTISADVAWDISKGDPDVVVAIFDSGTDWQHPDLVENVRQDLMFDASDDGDVDPSPQCQGQQDGLTESPICPGNAPFRESHGTSVSGTVAARGDNNIGLSGVCPLCSLAPVRLLGEATQDALTIAEAFVRSCDPTGDRTGQGAAIINNSWGPGFSNFFPLSQSERNSFNLCRDVGRGGKGTLIVFAAGNDTSNVAGDAYAKHPYIIGVAASTNLDDWAAYSNYGEEVDVAAPSLGGTVNEDNFGIVTTDVRGDEGYSINGNTIDGTDMDLDYTNSFSGTSAASPVTAGLAGLILSVNPDLTAEQVRLVMTSTADKIRADKVDWLSIFGQDINEIFNYDENGHSIGFGYGRINAGRAVTLAGDAVALAAELGIAGTRCNPTTPAPGQCANCSAEGTCLTTCTTQAECPDGTVCGDGLCALPFVSPTDFLELCNADCEYCVASLTTEFEPESVCSKECTSDDECDPRCADGDPECVTDRFDCRPLTNEVGGTAICAQGSPNSGGPADFRSCDFNLFTGTSVIVVSDAGKELCGETCFSDGPADCPFGFTCGEATCECTRQGGNGGCREVTCSAGSDNIGVGVCLPNPGHADICETDLDCQFGDFCEVVDGAGTCRFDDRAGCDVCQPCADSSECGGRGSCLSGVCTVACDDGEVCPGGSTCRDVSFEIFQGRFAQAKACLGTAGDFADVETLPAEACGNFTCRVPECRDGRPCADGNICIDGACVDDGSEDEGPGIDDLRLSGGGPNCGGCASTGESSVAGLALMLLALFRRRRH